ncbi:MAG: type IV pilus modification protein PilV [Thiohalobacteraceae bacterium]|nr:type IV pilus modification protein PilV [Gammaproteobacteria bacterium]
MSALKRPPSTHIPTPRHGVRSNGFSLIEILITVLILAIGLLGLAGLQGASLRNNQSAYVRTQATNLAYEIVDAMRANVTVARAGGYDLAYGAASSSGGIAQDDLNTWRARVTTVLANGDSEIARAGDVFTIRVRWDDSRGAEAPQVFEMVTRL